MKNIAKFINISKEISKINQSDENVYSERSEKLLEEYKSKGYIKKMPLELLNLEYYDFIPLLEYLLKENNNILKSPVEDKDNSNWMSESSFCFFNIRGMGKTHNKTGNFIDAVKILPSLRVTGIHIAPFFECALSIVYAIDTLDTINQDCINKTFMDYGMSGEEQLSFFVDVCHLLGLTVGFDLEPHTAQFSRIVVEKPHLFRWLKFDKNKKLVMNESDMLKDDNQRIICNEIKNIKESILKENNLKNLEVKGKENQTKEIHRKIVNKLIDCGYWTIPSHTWKGAGLPEFEKYNFNDNYPQFKYISWENEDHKHHSFGVLTPYKFYDNIPLNSIPNEQNKPVLNKETLNYFINIFPKLQKRYNFDFVRFDFVDHIFDSIIDENTPYSDKLTPYIIKRTISRARFGNKKYIGAMAERMGNDLKDYKRIGFDLILGDDILYRLDEDFINKVMKTNRIIEKINKNKKNYSSIIFAVDTHDTGHKEFNCLPMKLYGVNGVGLRLFTSRFLQDKNVKRPKYEVIGNQDGSTGLYEANNKEISINWQNNLDMLNIYHNIEDLYEEFKDIIRQGSLTATKKYKKYISSWTIENESFKMIFGINFNTTKEITNIKIEEKDITKNSYIINPFTKEKKIFEGQVIKKLSPLNCFIIYRLF